jgi:hypothetical protein
MEKVKSSPNDRMIVREDYLRKKQRYWANTGKYQEISKQLFQKVEDLGKNGEINWEDDEIAHLTLFNGISGCYYSYYNDGDDAFGSIDNNRVHGFRSLESFSEFCKDQGATLAQRYVNSSKRSQKHPYSRNDEESDDYIVYVDEDLLEKAMDEVILLARSIEKIK